MWNKVFTITTFFLAVLYATSPIVTLGEEYQLFDEAGNRIQDYDRLLDLQSFGEEGSLKSGDILKFADGSEFLVEGPLGSGNSTAVLRVTKLKPVRSISPSALRLSIRHMNYGFHSNETFLAGYQELYDEGIDMPKKISHFKTQYVEVEKVAYRDTLSDFIINPDRYPEREAKEMMEALRDFSRYSSQFTEIADFSPRQLVYDPTGKRWILLDWTKIHINYSDVVLGAGQYLRSSLDRPGSNVEKLKKQYDAWIQGTISDSDAFERGFQDDLTYHRFSSNEEAEEIWKRFRHVQQEMRRATLEVRENPLIWLGPCMRRKLERLMAA